MTTLLSILLFIFLLRIMISIGFGLVKIVFGLVFVFALIAFLPLGLILLLPLTVLFGIIMILKLIF